MTMGGETADTSGKNLEFVILDDRIGEKVVGDLMELGFRRPINLNLDRLADTNGADSREAEMFDGTTGGDSGWIKNGWFRHDGDDGFHKGWKIGL
jgi:hypothetical protein